MGGTTSRGRPRLVLITGEPGSGKSTLGRELGIALRVPFLARDDVRGGLFATAGAWSDQVCAVPTADDAVDAFLRIVETTTGLGVSCVVELLVRRSRPRDLERLTTAADCVAVVTTCDDPMGRFVDRNRNDRLMNRPEVLDALGYGSIDEQTDHAVARMRDAAAEMRTDLGIPTMTVRTDDGYDPTLDQIVAFATRPRGSA